MKWNNSTRTEYSTLLDFGAPGFAYIYYSETSKRKKFLPRSIFKYFVGMESQTTLIKVFIKETKKIINLRRNDFKRHEDNILPGDGALLNGLSRQIARENDESGKLKQKPCYSMPL